MSEKNLEKLTDKQALQDFLLDIDCLKELSPWSEKFNMFDVLKISRTEIRHSNMLAWIMDPNENHGYGDEFLKRFIQRIVANTGDASNDIFHMLLMDLYSFRVLREWRNIDILLISDEEKEVIAIENKVGSHEHSNQLEKYREIVEKEYPEYNSKYIFLTPEGEAPSDEKNWEIFTYNDVVEILEELHHEIQVSPDVELMVRNYIEVIRRDIVEDQQLIEICNKIYNKHKKALDLIFENRIDGKSQLFEAVNNSLKKLCDEGLIYNLGSYNMFLTSTMDEILEPLEDDISSWNDKSLYKYWIRVDKNRIYGIYELGGMNVPDEKKPVMQKIIDKLKPNDNKKKFKYKRVYRTKWYNIKDDVDDYEEEVEKKVRKVVDDLLKEEHEIVSLIPSVNLEAK